MIASYSWCRFERIFESSKHIMFKKLAWDDLRFVTWLPYAWSSPSHCDQSAILRQTVFKLCSRPKAWQENILHIITPQPVWIIDIRPDGSMFSCCFKFWPFEMSQQKLTLITQAPAMVQFYLTSAYCSPCFLSLGVTPSVVFCFKVQLVVHLEMLFCILLL